MNTSRLLRSGWLLMAAIVFVATSATIMVGCGAGTEAGPVAPSQTTAGRDEPTPTPTPTPTDDGVPIEHDPSPEDGVPIEHDPD